MLRVSCYSLLRGVSWWMNERPLKHRGLFLHVFFFFFFYEWKSKCIIMRVKYTVWVYSSFEDSRMMVVVISFTFTFTQFILMICFHSMFLFLWSWHIKSVKRSLIIGTLSPSFAFPHILLSCATAPEPAACMSKWLTSTYGEHAHCWNCQWK